MSRARGWIRGEYILMENLTMEQFREKMCARCVVTNVELDEGHALELCSDCPLNMLHSIGPMKPVEVKKDAGEKIVMIIKDKLLNLYRMQGTRKTNNIEIQIKVLEGLLKEIMEAEEHG